MEPFEGLAKYAGQIGLVLFVIFALVKFMPALVAAIVKLHSDSTEEFKRNNISKPSRNLQRYFVDRLGYKINVYDKLGDKYKWIFWSMTSISMICAAIVPVLINQKGCEVWATGLSLVVTIMVGLQGIFHPREHWRNYDMISATLRREEMLFSTQSGEYENLNDENQRFRLLVRRVEELISREREETIIMRTSEKENSTPSKTSTKLIEQQPSVHS
jgi:hypothetical protein